MLIKLTQSKFSIGNPIIFNPENVQYIKPCGSGSVVQFSAGVWQECKESLQDKLPLQTSAP